LSLTVSMCVTVKTVPKEEMVACIPSLLSNLEDRNADVRKNAADAVLGVMIHTGYGPLSNACDKLKVRKHHSSGT
jgi:cytoskeleton-associated protein 5